MKLAIDKVSLDSLDAEESQKWINAEVVCVSMAEDPSIWNSSNDEFLSYELLKLALQVLKTPNEAISVYVDDVVISSLESFNDHQLECLQAKYWVVVCYVLSWNAQQVVVNSFFISCY